MTVSTIGAARDEHHPQVVDVGARGASGDQSFTRPQSLAGVVLVECFAGIYTVLTDGGRGLAGHESSCGVRRAVGAVGIYGQSCPGFNTLQF